MFPQDTRILIAEDALTVANIIKSALKTMGYTHIEIAGDGEAALETLLDALDGPNKFGFVIADIHMPHMTGIQLLDSCKKDRELQDIPFLIVTTETEKKTVLSAVVKGAAGYLIKPFTAEDLKKRIEEVYSKTMLSRKGFTAL